MPTDIVKPLEAQVIGIQYLLCSKQKQMHDSFKRAADATKDVSLVDSLDMDDMELESIDTTMTSVDASDMKLSPLNSELVSTLAHLQFPTMPLYNTGNGSQTPQKNSSNTRLLKR